jgi:hypothetical protein
MAITYIQIGTTVTVGSGGATSIDFTSIPSTYTDLVLVFSCRSDLAGVYGNNILNINGGTTSQSVRQLYGTGSAGFSITDTPIYSASMTQAGATASTFSNESIYIPNYASTTTNKSISWDGVSESNSTTAGAAMNAGLYASTTAITSLTIKPNGSPTNKYVEYSTASLYGIKNS